MAFPCLYPTGTGDFTTAKAAGIKEATFYKTRIQQLPFRRTPDWQIYASQASVHRAVRAGIFACTKTGKNLGR
jgi:hypothetical protein